MGRIPTFFCETRVTMVERARELIVNLLEAKKVDLVQLTYRREGGRMVLRLLADRPKGGITISECSMLSAKISALLDESDLIGGRFFLEVCSPGLDRPLKTPDDFTRNIGRRVKVTIPNPEDPQKKVSVVGAIKGVDEDAVEIDTEEEAAQSIRLKQIIKAKLIVRIKE